MDKEKFVLKCLGCGREYTALRLTCADGCQAFLRTEYRNKNFSPTRDSSLFKFMDWLPCYQKIETTIGPVVYRSEHLGRHLGLDQLYCAFNGYWPEKGARNMTGTFKDYEALPTMMSFMDNGKKSIILSSVGNTGRAFAYATTLMDFDTYIVIPERMIDRMWVPSKGSVGRIHIIAVKEGCDYYEAIRLGDKISKDYQIETEGGAKNVARRDGMGTVILEAVRVLGRLPAHYFQAIGSGTGGIAAYEASMRIMQDPQFEGQTMPKMNLAQNAPFAPIYNAWERSIPIKPEEDVEDQIDRVRQMYADVLANRNPAYYIKGGVLDVLTQTRGCMYQIDNQEAIAAALLFEKLEGIDILPPASVCVAALIQAVKKGFVKQNETILLNITGGGLKRIKRDYECTQLEPEIIVDHDHFDLSEIIACA